MDYIVVENNDKSIFIKEVESNIKKGGELIGGVSTSFEQRASPYYRTTYFQAMLVPKKKK